MSENLTELNGSEIFENWDQLVGEKSVSPKETLDSGLLDSLMSEEKGQDYWVNLFQTENFAGMDLMTVKYTPYTINELDFHQKFQEMKSFFVKDLTQQYMNDLRSADLSEESIFYLGKGILPANWTVHLKYPLLYGGKLEPGNLILIPEHPFHELIHHYINQQILSEAGICHPKMLYLPVPVGKVYLTHSDWTGSGGKATSDRSVMAGMTAATLQKLGGR